MALSIQKYGYLCANTYILVGRVQSVIPLHRVRMRSILESTIQIIKRYYNIDTFSVRVGAVTSVCVGACSSWSSYSGRARTRKYL